MDIRWAKFGRVFSYSVFCPSSPSIEAFSFFGGGRTTLSIGRDKNSIKPRQHLCQLITYPGKEGFTALGSVRGPDSRFGVLIGKNETHWVTKVWFIIWIAFRFSFVSFRFACYYFFQLSAKFSFFFILPLSLFLFILLVFKLSLNLLERLKKISIWVLDEKGPRNRSTINLLVARL